MKYKYFNMKYYLTQDPAWRIVVTTGIKPSSNIDSALESAMYGRSSELGLYQTYTSAHPFDTIVAGLTSAAF